MCYLRCMKTSLLAQSMVQVLERKTLSWATRAVAALCMHTTTLWCSDSNAPIMGQRIGGLPTTGVVLLVSTCVNLTPTICLFILSPYLAPA